MDGFSVDVRQLHAHAGKIDAIQRRLVAIQAATAAINQDPSSYGKLCAWIGGILDGRQVRQGGLLAYVSENLTLSTDALIQTGREYDEADAGTADRIRHAGHH